MRIASKAYRPADQETQRPVATKSKSLPDSSAISKFALIRWDELDEVAFQLVDLLGDQRVITEELLAESLRRLKDGKARSLGEYCRFLSDPGSYERFDASKNALWIVSEIDEIDITKDELPTSVRKLGERAVIKSAIGGLDRIKVNGYVPEKSRSTESKSSLGTIRLKKRTVLP